MHDKVQDKYRIAKISIWPCLLIVESATCKQKGRLISAMKSGYILAHVLLVLGFRLMRSEELAHIQVLKHTSHQSKTKPLSVCECVKEAVRSHKVETDHNFSISLSWTSSLSNNTPDLADVTANRT
ncbi:unnamed protein product [Dovyalis caffra]|uniref:Uncharacterized protein n=1 Tax=Dovyalis caffra TaxID=77055 RepID=A0AAV1RIZ5_9ROSI|nr:unnamed protein product [Dovyalis caffra]